MTPTSSSVSAAVEKILYCLARIADFATNKRIIAAPGDLYGVKEHD